MPRVIKLDTKGEALAKVQRKNEHPWRGVSSNDMVIVQTLDDLKKADHPYIIYCPVLEELEFDAFNDFFFYVYRDLAWTNTITWVDEMMEISTSRTIPPGLKALYTKGRYQTTPVWACTQRPVGIDPMCLSQSTHMFTFDLPRFQDRKFVSDSAGVPEFMEEPGGYNFWYFRRGWKHATKGVIRLRS